jgi:hypothetical protein
VEGRGHADHNDTYDYGADDHDDDAAGAGRVDDYRLAVESHVQP